MKFSIEQSELLKGLNAVNKIVKNNKVNAILECVKITHIKNKLRLVATDLNMSIVYDIQCFDVEGDDNIVKVSDFIGILSKLSGKIYYDDGLIITPNSKFSLPLYNDEFPNVDIAEILSAENGIKVNGNDFVSGLAKVSYATQVGYNNTILSGISVDKDELCATDGNRLACCKIKQELENIVIPQSLALEVIKLFKDDFTMVKDTNKVSFYDENVILSASLLSGQFPNYRPLIPTTFGKSLTVDKSELLNALNIISPVSDICMLEINKNEMIISSGNTTGLKGDITIDIESDIEDFKIGFNLKYLIEALRNFVEDKITINFNGELSPIVIKPNDDDLSLIMPIQINK